MTGPSQCSQIVRMFLTVVKSLYYLNNLSIYQQTIWKKIYYKYLKYDWADNTFEHAFLSSFPVTINPHMNVFLHEQYNNRYNQIQNCRSFQGKELQK